MSEEIERDCLTLCHAVSASERVVTVEINQFKPIFASDPISVYENCLHPFLEIDAVNSDVYFNHTNKWLYIFQLPSCQDWHLIRRRMMSFMLPTYHFASKQTNSLVSKDVGQAHQSPHGAACHHTRRTLSHENGCC